MTWVSQVSLLPIHLLRHLLICRQPKAFPRVLERQFRVQNTNGKTYHQQINLYQVPSAYSACAKAACVWYRLLQSVKVQILYQRLNTCWVLLLQNIVCVKIKDQLVALSVVWGFYPLPNSFQLPPKVFTSPRPSPGKRLPCTHLWRSRTFSRVRKIKWLFSGSMVYDVSSKQLPPHRQKPRWKNQNRSHRSILFKRSWQVA